MFPVLEPVLLPWLLLLDGIVVPVLLALDLVAALAVPDATVPPWALAALLVALLALADTFSA